MMCIYDVYVSYIYMYSVYIYIYIYYVYLHMTMCIQHSGGLSSSFIWRPSLIE